jgi:hypothetical protein
MGPSRWLFEPGKHIGTAPQRTKSGFTGHESSLRVKGSGANKKGREVSLAAS